MTVFYRHFHSFWARDFGPVQVLQIQELFTESKKLDPLVSYVVSKSDVSKTYLLILP